MPINSGNFKKGIIPWNKGKKGVYSEETLKKISEASKRRIVTDATKEKIRLSLIGNRRRRGIKHKPETIERMRKSKAGQPGRKWSKEQREKKSIQSLIRFQKETIKEIKGGKDGLTDIERIVFDELKKRDVRFEQQKIINGRFLVDFYIPSRNTIIECDGDFWHSLDRVKKKDKSENAYLKKCGYRLLRWKGKDIKSDISNLLNQL